MEFHLTKLQLSRQELEDLYANAKQAKIALRSDVRVYIVQLIVDIVLLFSLILFLARIPKNSVVLDPVCLQS